MSFIYNYSISSINLIYNLTFHLSQYNNSFYNYIYIFWIYLLFLINIINNNIYITKK